MLLHEHSMLAFKVLEANTRSFILGIATSGVFKRTSQNSAVLCERTMVLNVLRRDQFGNKANVGKNNAKN